MQSARPHHLTQAEFSRLQGWNRSTVTRLKQGGRLVLDDHGHVDVAASLARIAETGGMRFDVAARHTEERTAKTAACGPAVAGEGQGTGEGANGAGRGTSGPSGGENRAEAQARKESAAADLLEIELAEKRRQVIAKDDVDQALKTFAAATRSRLDVLADQLAPIVAPVTDLGEVHALLAEQARLVLAGIADDMQRAEAALGAPGA